MTAWIDLAGWTLVHFVWQGALVAALTALALRLVRDGSPHVRYALSGVALAVMVALPVATAIVLSRAPSAPPAPGPALFATEMPPPHAAEAGARADGSPAPGTATATPAGGWAAGAALARVLPAIVILWLSGVAVLLTRLAGGCWRVGRLHRAALLAPASRWQAAAERVACSLGLRRGVLVVDSVRVETPTVIGWLRPVILLPLAAMTSLTPAQVEAILAHEIAHIRRHDFAVNLLQTIAETLLFYHPAVWWISRRVRIEREHCCDDVAVGVCGDAVTYASALTDLAAWTIARPPLAIAATGGTLIARVQRLLDPADGTPRSSSGMLVFGLAVVLVLVVGSLRVISLAQTVEPGPAGERRFGPMEVNRLLGFDLFPRPVQWATDDPRGGRAWGVTINHAGGELPLVGFTGRSLIRHAYGLVGTPIVNAPEWLDAETFELLIAADLPDPTHPEAMQAPLREMFEERLGLVARTEVRDFPVYALVRANADGTLGPNISVASAGCVSGMARLDRLQQMERSGGPALRARGEATPVCGMDDGFFGISGRGMTMGELVAGMRHQMNPLAPDRPVVDRTRLAGTYDFTLRFGPLPLAAAGFGNPSLGAMLSPFGIRSLFTALPEQLGLRLIESTAPFDVLVIDRIHRPAS